MAVAFIAALAAMPAGAQQPPGEWPLATKDYANTRFSGLGEITPSNVGNLCFAFTFSAGSAGQRVCAARFFVNLFITYPMMPWVCGNQRHGVLHLVEAIFLAIAAQWLTAFVVPPCMA